MVNTLLYQSLPKPGCILYLPKAQEINLSSWDNADLPNPEACDHPVVVLHVDATERLASILIITSFGGQTLAQKHGQNSQIMPEHMPLDPAGPQDDGKVLTMLGGQKMKKASWVKLTPVYKVPASVLVHDRKVLRNLTPESYNMLVKAVGGKPSASAPIYHAVQANRVSQPVTFQDGWAVYPQVADGPSSQSTPRTVRSASTTSDYSPAGHYYQYEYGSTQQPQQQSTSYPPVAVAAAKPPRRGPLGQQRLWQRVDEESRLLDNFWPLHQNSNERAVPYWRESGSSTIPGTMRRVSLRQRLQYYSNLALRFLGNLLIVAVCIGLLWAICLSGVQVVSAVQFILVSAVTYFKHVARVIAEGFAYGASAVRYVAEFVGLLIERVVALLKEVLGTSGSVYM